MSNRVQHQNETVYTYFHDKMRMCHRLMMSESEAKKKMLCAGFISRNLCTSLMSGSFLKETEIMAGL